MDITEVIRYIVTSETVPSDATFDIYKDCSDLLLTDDILGRQLLINILDNRYKFPPSMDAMLADIAEAAGFYPYMRKENLTSFSMGGRIRQEYHRSEFLEEKYFHEDQKYLLSLLNGDKNVIVSAPTSFGKSLLIEEIVASKRFTNIVVIQPTLALLDETRRKFLNYRDSYKIIVRTSQRPSETKGNLFLLTAERATEYPDFPDIDFLIIDEFYKFSAKRDDERSDSLNNAFLSIFGNHNCRFYLLGPNIDSISPGFTEKYNALFYATKYNVVDCDTVDVYKAYEGQFGEGKYQKLFKEQKLFELLYSLKDEQTIIYCSSPSRVRDLSNKFAGYLQDLNIEITHEDLPLVEWIEKYLDERWSLINLLNHRIGIHDGALQKHITTSILDYFNSNKLNYLFCTTTIIEGVNTSAKNIVYFDKTKGKRTPLDFFDYSNIKGRAGRFMVHYKGRIFNFNSPPKDERVVIDIPLFEQNPVSDEILIQLPKDEVRDTESEQYKKICELNTEESLLFKQNGLNVFGQKAILDKLRNDMFANFEIISWNGMPTYRQLEYALSLAWHNLLRNGESTAPMTLKKLINVTFNYGLNRGMEDLIKNSYLYLKAQKGNVHLSEQQVLDKAILDSFQILKHWFQYKIPKWLSVVNSLQIFVCNERNILPGNYMRYASLIENEFVQDNLAILNDYGIPNSAIKKLQEYIPEEINEDEIIGTILKDRVYSYPEFIPYEREKILQNLR